MRNVKPLNISRVEVPKEKITPDQKEILKSAINFAEYLTGRWPQVELSELPERIETKKD
jgi:hypothetical protein